MLIAAEEGMVWEACASWVPEPADRGVAEIDRTRESVTRLMELGLLWMYRISEGNPDLTAAEAMRVIDDRRRGSTTRAAHMMSRRPDRRSGRRRRRQGRRPEDHLPHAVLLVDA